MRTYAKAPQKAGSPARAGAAAASAHARVAVPAPSPLETRIDRTGLPARLKAGVETLSGHSLDNVSVHYNSSRPAQLRAHAFAQGADIYLAPGREACLPHETWHVAQQMQGRVTPTLRRTDGVSVNTDPRLEREADVMGRRALAAPPAARPAPPTRQAASGGGVAQLMPAGDIKLGKWYRIEGVEGPRYLKTRRFPQGGEASWEFYTHPLGMAKGEAPLVVKDPEKVLGFAEAPPAAEAQEWGKGATDHKIFGLDNKTKDAVRAAVEIGYRCFDAAKTYSFTVADLADVLRASKLPRSSFKVVYKIGHGSTKDDLDKVIEEALRHLGYIDVLMVHESTTDLAKNIRTINRYIAMGLVKTGGLSNVTGFDLDGVDESQLKNMVMLQDSPATVKQAREVDSGLRAKGKLESAGVRVKDSIYGLHRGVTFTATESQKLKELGVTETQARTIWASHHGFGEVTSSSDPSLIAENFATPRVSASVASAVVALIDEKPEQSGADKETKASEDWAHPGLEEIARAATNNARSNNLEAFLAVLSEIVDKDKGKLRKILLTQSPWALHLKSSDLATNKVYQGITWAGLLKGDASLGAACNKADLLNAIAEAVVALNKHLSQ